MSRSFTVESISGGRANYAGGRFVSATPAGAARKAFSRAVRMMNGRGPVSLNIEVKETTRGSAGKVFGYRVSRVAQKRQVERDGVLINYKFTTKVKAM